MFESAWTQAAERQRERIMTSSRRLAASREVAGRSPSTRWTRVRIARAPTLPGLVLAIGVVVLLASR
jgi:hypothetical protein